MPEQDDTSQAVGTPVATPCVKHTACAGRVCLYPPKRLANLRPWPRGTSGNPSGLTKDGEAPKVAKLRASLLAHLAKPGGMDRLAKKWLTMAMKGSYPHLAAILERLDPIEKDSGQQREVLRGITLELTAQDGSSASLTLNSTQAEQQQALAPRDVELEPPS